MCCDSAKIYAERIVVTHMEHLNSNMGDQPNAHPPRIKLGADGELEEPMPVPEIGTYRRSRLRRLVDAVTTSRDTSTLPTKTSKISVSTRLNQLFRGWGLVCIVTIVVMCLAVLSGANNDYMMPILLIGNIVMLIAGAMLWFQSERH
jgi:hypothetical protein